MNTGYIELSSSRIIESVQRIATARSFLFVPGDRLDRFDKAMGAGADMIILDLENALAPSAKIAAREAVVAKLTPEHSVVIRINAAGTEWFQDDLALSTQLGVAGIMLPKSISGEVMNNLGV